MRPRAAALAGVAAVALLTLGVHALADVLHRPAQALLLVLPVVVTALVGGVWPANVVAAAATLSLSLVLPPVGSPRVHVADDLVALVVFGLVAVTVGTLVARHVAALDRLDVERRALVRSVSHELRTPLAAIQAAVGELATEHHDESARAALLEMAGAEAARLDRLVSNLLGMARVEGGPGALRLDVVDLGEIASAAVARQAELRGAAVTIEVGDDLPPLRGDAVLLDQVVTNLVENAVRHCAGHPVEVDVRRAGDAVRLEVVDHGPGVAPEDRAVIFRPFRSGANAGSAGLGLALSRGAVALHHGTVDVVPTPGGGATFVVVVPVSRR